MIEENTEQNIEARSYLFFQFAALYNEYISQPRDYGTGDSFTALEIHILSKIAHSPAITANELTEIFRKSKGFISKILSKLEDLGLIYKVKPSEKSRVLHLYVTEKGKQYSLAHTAYDNIGYLKMQEHILKEFSDEQLDTFFSILDNVCKLYHEILD